MCNYEEIKMRSSLIHRKKITCARFYSQGNRAEIPRETLEQAVEEVMAEGKATGLYDVNYVKLCDVEKAKRDANNLFKAGEDRWGTDEATFTRIFATRDYYQLRETWKQYTKVGR